MVSNKKFESKRTRLWMLTIQIHHTEKEEDVNQNIELKYDLKKREFV